ncbi:MAG: hypothetical protein ACPF8V_11675, partial [Luteibaculum sp.]
SMALRNSDEAKKWLMTNGFPHLMALVDGAEGNRKAITWLRKKDFEALAMVAAAGDGEEVGFRWLKQNQQPELFYVAEKIRLLKENIESRNNDPHRINF